MSQANGQVNSTPNKNRTSARSQAGNQQYLRDDVKDDLELDLGNATKCDVDSILKYFLYLVLDKDSEEKKELDELQDEIEILQEERYYKMENDDTTPDGNEGASTGVYEQARREAPHDDTTTAISEKEEELVRRRDAILDDIFGKIIQHVLPIANQKQVRALLLEFGDAFTKEERSRYGPYVSLCNYVLDALKLAVETVQVRAPDQLDIRFHRNDPRIIYSNFIGMLHQLERVPDVIITSLHAAIQKGNGETGRFVRAPRKGRRFNWESIHSSNEFKIFGKGKIPESVKTVRKEGFEFDASRGPKIEHHELISQDQEVAEEEETSKVSTPTTSKRTRDEEEEEDEEEEDEVADGAEADEEDEDDKEEDEDDKEEEDEEEADPDFLHVRKKRRGSNSVSPIPSGSKRTGSKANSAAGRVKSESKPQTNSQTRIKLESQTKQAVSGRVQCASYAMEALSYSAGVHHAINLLFTDDYLWIWYYDRQGIIQSNGMSIFSDFPRFLVLLFALQRFNLEDWGIIQCLNPKACLAHGLATEKPEEKPEDQPTGSSNSVQQGTGKQGAGGKGTKGKGTKGKLTKGKGKKGKGKARHSPPPPPPPPPPLPIISSHPVVLPLDENLEHSWFDHNRPLVQVQIDMNTFLSHQPHCLAGRATAVVSAIGLNESFEETPMVCKIYHPEVQRRHEGLTLQVIHNIANEHNSKMLRHLPSMYFHVDIPNTTTQRIRSMVRRSWKGHRVLRVLGLKKLKKVTTADGGEFVKAWLEVVTCHSFLWKHHVEHGDPSVNNMMYDPEEQCGVLTDFDLSLLQWEPRVFGTDRTGTVPFMAIEILTKAYWDGQISRLYYHELESFIWILPYVFLLYEAGIRRPNPCVDAWRTSDYDTCLKEKLRFLTTAALDDAERTVKPNFQAFWELARRLCRALSNFRSNHENHIDEYRPNRPPPSLGSNDLWDRFVTTVKLQYPEDHEFHDLILRLEAEKPSFDELDGTLRETLRNQFKPILQRRFNTRING